MGYIKKTNAQGENKNQWLKEEFMGVVTGFHRHWAEISMKSVLACIIKSEYRWYITLCSGCESKNIFIPA